MLLIVIPFIINAAAFHNAWGNVHTLTNPYPFVRAALPPSRHKSSSSQAKRSSNSSRGSHIDSPLSFRGGKKEKGSGGNKVGFLGRGRSRTDMAADGGRSNKRLVHQVVHVKRLFFL